MTVLITPELLRAVRPDLPLTIARVLAPKLQDAAEGAGITTRLRVAHLLAQLGHESGFQPREENLWYSAPRICQVWPSRFPTLESAKPYAMNPAGLANRVYAGRLGNGNEASGDGYRYRGRGLLQITGRSNYRTYGKLIGFDLEAQPELALQFGIGSLVAVAYWTQRNINRLADQDDLQAVTRAVNGGLTGLEDRGVLLRRAKAFLK
ncbi:glycoside hydrolase family 19 protein [Deinococcus misasensis]|uniref:glycoside hydrolase family 19 protein n=1 Tax=Deinococcus misasensis TaxID=392413 RepID=UPI0005598291|nr:glycoside hydrolase family 19 protein [Deinococcus misasensis]